ncbi:hypothetical protein LOC54_03285 [Acetobacter sp. AN02]|uniref:hypothetical protein n=1 Tax=Acetobacter sp. AN02 TaxID=2894186 RepID=UPI0024345D71|nr:hypothetical protein [Acetobacter sp. AN02]MDG6094147.1 hypothetical protein [Acetobacter sp. AN02]
MNTSPPDSSGKPASTPIRKGLFGRGQPRSLKQHLARRLMIVLPLVVLSLILAKTGVLDRMADRYTFKPVSWFDDSALVRHLRVVVTGNGMTSARPDCLLFVVDGNSPVNATKIEVMEKHSGTCPNPDNSLPRLFTLQVNRPAQSVLTDQGTPGSFHPLPR